MNRSHGQIERFVERTHSQGRYTFTATDVGEATSLSPSGIEVALRRLEAGGRLLRPMPRRWFFIIVPAEFRTIGVPPLPWWVDSFMRFLQQPRYYVALLTAAEWHGSSHFAAQETQIMVERQIRPLKIGRERLRFVTKSTSARSATDRQTFTGGTVRVGTPETTAVDLVRYVRVAGGLSNVATILSSLPVSPALLIRALEIEADIPAAQRLGYLLQSVARGEAAKATADFIGGHQHQTRLLDPSGPSDDGQVATPWDVLVNAPVEAAG